MSARGDFVRRLREELNTRLKIEFEEGVVEGPQPDRDIGCVWFDRKRPWSRDGNIEENFYRVRVFRRWMQDQGGTEPKATAHGHLLDVQEELEEALQSVLTTVGHGFFNVMEVAPNHQQHSVEAQLTAYDRNRSAAGG